MTQKVRFKIYFVTKMTYSGRYLLQSGFQMFHWTKAEAKCARQRCVVRTPYDAEEGNAVLSKHLMMLSLKL
jgi:hypothetical protein